MVWSVVIISYNTRNLLAACLASVRADEIIVVDNASSDGSVEVVRANFSRVRLIPNAENVGYARANNQGIRASTGEYILLLNPDTVVEADALNRLASFLDAHPRAGAVGLQLLNSDGTLQPSGKNFPTLVSAIGELLPTPELWRSRLRGNLEQRDYAQVCQVDQVSGAAMCLCRAAVDEVGLLDEEFFFLGEDIDLCWRLKKAGWQIFYLPDARVIHHWGSSRNKVDSYRISLFAQRSYYLLFRKHRSRVETCLLKLFLIGLTCLKLFKWVLLSLARGALRQTMMAHLSELGWLMRN